MHRSLPAVFIMIILLWNSGAHAQDFWESTNGPYNVTIYSLAENSSGDLFSGAGGDGGVFRLSHNSASWKQIRPGSGVMFCLSIR